MVFSEVFFSPLFSTKKPCAFFFTSLIFARCIIFLAINSYMPIFHQMFILSDLLPCLAGKCQNSVLLVMKFGQHFTFITLSFSPVTTLRIPRNFSLLCQYHLHHMRYNLLEFLNIVQYIIDITTYCHNLLALIFPPTVLCIPATYNISLHILHGQPSITLSHGAILYQSIYLLLLLRDNLKIIQYFLIFPISLYKISYMSWQTLSVTCHNFLLFCIFCYTSRFHHLSILSLIFHFL